MVDLYELRGVSASKPDVHAAIQNLDPGLYPGAFCTILPDVLTFNKDYCLIQHADGAGTKAALAYLWWKITGDLDVWKRISQDSMVMNLDDMVCAGALGPFIVSMTIARNKHRIPGEVITALIEGCREFCEFLTDLGFPCYLAGGETADLGDLVRTLTVDHTITCRFPRAQVIDAGRITTPGLIVGFSSTGQAAWEDAPNSGIGSNGFTNARHDTLWPGYRWRYTETYAPETALGLIYRGPYGISYPLPEDPRFTIGSALLSPTRTYLPLIGRIVRQIGPRHIKGFIHCSGGGQTKIGKFGSLGIVYIKNNLFPVPPVFQILRRVSNMAWREMYPAYNMGHRLEVMVQEQVVADACIELAAECGIEAQIMARSCRAKKTPIAERWSSKQQIGSLPTIFNSSLFSYPKARRARLGIFSFLVLDFGKNLSDFFHAVPVVNGDGKSA